MPEKLPSKFQESVFALKYNEWRRKIEKSEDHLDYKDLLMNVVNAVGVPRNIVSEIKMSDIDAPKLIIDLEDGDD